MWLWLEHRCTVCGDAYEWLAPDGHQPLTCGQQRCIDLLYTGAGSCVQHRLPLFRSTANGRWHCTAGPHKEPPRETCKHYAMSCVEHRCLVTYNRRRWICMRCFRKTRKTPDKRPPAQCLACDTPAVVRGLCMRCYRRYSQRIHKGRTTWDRLEAEGLVLPDMRKGGSNVSSCVGGA